MKPGMTRWKGDPLYPKPFLPVQSSTKFVAVLGTTSTRTCMVTRPAASPPIEMSNHGFGFDRTVSASVLVFSHCAAIHSSSAARSANRVLSLLPSVSQSFTFFAFHSSHPATSFSVHSSSFSATFTYGYSSSSKSAIVVAKALFFFVLLRVLFF